MREIKRFIQIDDAQNIEQVYSAVTEYIETYHGHVVAGLWEAENWLRGEDDERIDHRGRRRDLRSRYCDLS